VGTNVGDKITVAMLQAGLQNTTDSIVYWANKNEITRNNGKTKITCYIMRNNSIPCEARNHQHF
jgi:Tfp pilus assembly major pilin PilA